MLFQRGLQIAWNDCRALRVVHVPVQRPSSFGALHLGETGWAHLAAGDACLRPVAVELRPHAPGGARSEPLQPAAVVVALLLAVDPAIAKRHFQRLRVRHGLPRRASLRNQQPDAGRCAVVRVEPSPPVVARRELHDGKLNLAWQARRVLPRLLRYARPIPSPWMGGEKQEDGSTTSPPGEGRGGPGTQVLGTSRRLCGWSMSAFIACAVAPDGPRLRVSEASRARGSARKRACKWRRGGDSNPRTGRTRLTVFETAAFNRSATSPRWRPHGRRPASRPRRGSRAAPLEG